MGVAVHGSVAVGEGIVGLQADRVLDHELGARRHALPIAEAVGVTEAGRTRADDDSGGVRAVPDDIVGVVDRAQAAVEGAVVDAGGDAIGELWMVEVHTAVDVRDDHALSVGLDPLEPARVAGTGVALLVDVAGNQLIRQLVTKLRAERAVGDRVDLRKLCQLLS